MILCLQLVMACEFSLGLLPYIKILLSSPTSRVPLRGDARGPLAGACSFVAAIFVVPFEAPGKWGMKGASVHSSPAGQGQPCRDHNAGAGAAGRPAAARTRVGDAEEVTPSHPVLHTGACLKKDENGEIAGIVSTTSLLLPCFSSVRGFCTSPAHGEKPKQ